jgi:uncharacterized phiE125 gp8 family phage protein
VQSVSSVTYVDEAGATQTLASSGYQVDVTSLPPRVTPAYGAYWPAARGTTYQAVRVTFVAGYGLAAAVPDALKAAIKLLTSHWYENREAAGAGWEELPLGVRSLAYQFWTGDYADVA